MPHRSTHIGQSPVIGPEKSLGGPLRRLRPVIARVVPSCSERGRAPATHLSDMTDVDLEILTPEQTAALLQVSPRTVEEWRRTRTGPPWRRMGRHVRYLRREVLVWFEDLD